MKTIQAKSPTELLDDAPDALIAHMIEVIGYAPDYVELDADAVQRFDTEKRGKEKGWVFANTSNYGIYATFGDHQTGTKYSWSSFNAAALPPRDLAEFRRGQQQRANEIAVATANECANAAFRAAGVWGAATPANPDHPYLKRKNVQPHGLRQIKNLLVPMINWQGELCYIQTISAEGEKRFATGKMQPGLFTLISDDGAWTHPDGVYICEGWATGASLHEAYGQPVYVAHGVSNLLRVAQGFRARFSAEIIVCADNDRKPNSNKIGLVKAEEVLKQCFNSSMLIPHFPDDAPDNLSDFNDYVNYDRIMQRNKMRVVK